MVLWNDGCLAFKPILNLGDWSNKQTHKQQTRKTAALLKVSSIASSFLNHQSFIFYESQNINFAQDLDACAYIVTFEDNLGIK